MEQVQTNLQHKEPHRETEYIQRNTIAQVTKKDQRDPVLKSQTVQNHSNKLSDSLSINPSFLNSNPQSITYPLNTYQPSHLNQYSKPIIHSQQINKNKTFQYSAHQNTIKIKPYINHQEHFGNYLCGSSQQFGPLQNYQPVLPISKNTPVHFRSNVNNINSVHNVNFVNPTQFIQPQIKAYTPLSSSSYNYSQVKPYVFSQPLSSSHSPVINFHKQQPIDQQYEKPLMNKVKNNKFPPKQNKNVSLITDDQIKRGFNNNLKIALEKVNKRQQQQQQYQQTNQKPIKPHQIQIVSNLVHQTYSPSKTYHQHMNSSQKKGKKRIFQNSKSRDKTRSLYEQSIVSFGTPQSIKMMNNLKNSVFDYQLKTERQQQNEMLIEKKIIVRKNNQIVGEQKQMQIPKQLVPKHILKAWQKLKDKN